MKSVVLIFLAAILQVSVAAVFDSPQSFEKAKQISSASKKPIMVVILKNGCTACNNLKTSCETDVSFKTALAKDFVLVTSVYKNNIHSEPAVSTLCLENRSKAYYPRTCFLRSDGTDLGVKVPNANEYLYFYSDSRDLKTSMSKAKKAF